MNYKWVGVDNLIARIETTYQIKSPEYINFLPLWITQGLNALRIKLPLEPYHTKRDVVNSIIQLPEDLAVLSLITKDDVPVLRTDKNMIKVISPQLYNDYVSIQLDGVETVELPGGGTYSKQLTRRSIPIEANVVIKPVESYLLHYNNVVEFSFESGQIELYYFRLPVTVDEYTSIRIPMIPDSEPVMTNLIWFILMNLLYRGYKHPVLNLGNAMPYLNPAKMYEDTKASARNSMLVWDSEEYEKISKVLTTFIHNVDYITRNFNA